MKYTEVRTGRIFIARCEHGEDLLDKVKALLIKEGVSAATITFIGALKSAKIVVGPDKPTLPVSPVKSEFDDGREILGSGVLVRRGEEVSFHSHAACGRGEDVVLGCLRKDTKVFITVEAVITEILSDNISRKEDETTGFDLLNFGEAEQTI